MKIAVTGGTGFVGSAIVSHLVGQGHAVTVLARHLPEIGQDVNEKLEYVRGNVVAGEGISDLLKEKDAVIHLVGIIREGGENTFDRVHRQGTENVLNEARKAGVRKFVQMSALGTREDAVSTYHRSKWAGEEAVRSSGLDWTIFRPSIIYGQFDSFINMLADIMVKFPVMPVLGGGGNLMQPVYVKDVARAFTEAVEETWSEGRLYELVGPDILSFKEILKLVSEVIDKKRIFVNIPIAVVGPLVGIAQKLGMPLPVTRDQLIMLKEDNVRKGGDSLDDFSFEFTPFREGIESYLINPKPKIQNPK